MDRSIENYIQTVCPEDLDPNWIRAIIMQESQGNPYCVRYEPSYQWVYQVEQFSKSVLISIQTELVTQKMSWGLGQIMGALAREQGHKGLMAELLKPDLNIEHICRRFKTLKTISNDPSDLFAMYNGGPQAVHKVNGRYFNQKYVDSVMVHLQNAHT